MRDARYRNIRDAVLTLSAPATSDKDHTRDARLSADWRGDGDER